MTSFRQNDEDADDAESANGDESDETESRKRKASEILTDDVRAEWFAQASQVSAMIRFRMSPFLFSIRSLSLVLMERSCQRLTSLIFCSVELFTEARHMFRKKVA